MTKHLWMFNIHSQSESVLNDCHYVSAASLASISTEMWKET